MPGPEEDLEEARESILGSREEGQQENIGALIDSIDTYISEGHAGEITFLTPENAKGLEECEVYQQNMEATLGFRIAALDKLMATKKIYTKSIDGRLINKKIDALSVLKADINAHVEHVSGIGEKLLGLDGNGPPRR